MISPSPYVFVALYILVDIVYVSLSNPVYNRIVKKISGETIPTNKNGFFLFAFLAYASMAFAWMVLVVPAVHHMISNGTSKWVAGVLAGIAYGLSVYGVFNGTLYTMFVGWDASIAFRDMLWGISWATILTVSFAITRK